MTDKQAINKWEAFKRQLEKATSPISETATEKERRIKHLEAHPEEWFKYYFPNYATAEPASFQKAATKRIFANENWYEVRAWCRGLAKSARIMFEGLKLTLTGKVRNVLLISHSQDQAIDLLTPWRLNLEFNARIINDYGLQRGISNWSEEEFLTKQGAAFKALGAGQSPRGTRNEAARPDLIIFDDIDTDEEVRNPLRVAKKWKWIEEAAIPTVDISAPYRIVFNGNIIGKDTCITRAMKYADHSEVKNIRDRNGKSTWSEKNTEEQIDQILSKLSPAAQQKEYFNNPQDEGMVFERMVWGKVPSLRKFRFLVNYCDPTYKSTQNSDTKAMVLLGFHEGKFYILKAYVARTTTSEMAGWFYAMADYVGEKSNVYHYMEANFIQDLLLDEMKRQSQDGFLSITPDRRHKGDKFTRIETALEPLVRNGELILNEKEKNNPHMVELERQFLALAPNSRDNDDAPDATEGAVWVIRKKLRGLKGGISTINNNNSSKHRY